MPIQTSKFNITAEQAAHVLWHFDEGGYQPGSFVQHLLRAFTSADLTNRHVLADTYPAYGVAVDAAANHPDGITWLQRIAAGEDQ